MQRLNMTSHPECARLRFIPVAVATSIYSILLVLLAENFVFSFVAHCVRSVKLPTCYSAFRRDKMH